jgi:DDE superfamily endonuclease
MTHDYIRHGTTTLFAALNVFDGTVIGQCITRHRHQEFIRFLNRIEAVVPAGKLIHAILDNYAAHKHPKVRAWLARHPRWTFHFTPHLLLLGQRGRDLLCLAAPAGGCNAAPSTRWSTCRRRSTATSASTTANPSPSSGPPIPTASSRRSIEGTKR